MTVIVNASQPSLITEFYPDPIDISITGERGLILLAEKDRYNSLSLYYYYSEGDHIAIN